MATTNLTAGQVSSGRITLTASAVDTVNAPSQWSHVEIIGYGQDDLFVTVDGSTPTVDGKNCYVLPAGSVSVRTLPVGTTGATKIQLISGGATKYVVQQAPDRFY